MEKGPGFSDTPSMHFLGTYAAHISPRRKVSNNGMIDLMATEGYRKEKNWLKHGMKTAHHPDSHQGHAGVIGIGDCSLGFWVWQVVIIEFVASKSRFRQSRTESVTIKVTWTSDVVQFDAPSTAILGCNG